MDLLTVSIGIVVILFAYLLVPKKKPTNFPPGPSRIPILGNVPKYSPQNHKEIMELSETYGPIIGLQLGSYWVVILNTAEDTRECFNRPEFSGRFGYNPFYEENVTDDTKGVAMSRGKFWHDMRRFSMKTLKDFGMGKRSSIESIIMYEVEELIDKFRKSSGKPISTQAVFNPSVLNIIWAIVAGERFKLGDKRIAVLLHAVFEIFQTGFTGIKLLNFLFPSVVNFTKMFPKTFGYNAMREAVVEFMKEAIQEHRRTMEVGNPRDFIDSFLEESIKTKEIPSSSFHDDVEDMTLVTLLTDMFGAGSETTSTTLTWTFYLLALYPEVQEKLYKEIQNIAGTRKVQLEDRPDMPYCEAVMTEVQRTSSLAPITIPHSTTVEVTYKGFTIPKNTIVAGNLYSAHYCKKTWGDPENFRPDRFLSKDGKSFVRNANVLPFSVGKRQCLGESLARDEHFLYMNNIIQQFKIVFPKDETKHSIVATHDLVRAPEPHRLILLDRNAA